MAVTVIIVAAVTLSKRSKRRSYRPCPAARDLQRFLDAHQVPIRQAAAGMKVTHGAVLSWLSGLSMPGAVNRKKIEIWTDKAVPELAWLRSAATLEEIKPFSAQSTTEPMRRKKPEHT